MTALLFVLGVVVFFTAILVSIGLHELGHMVPAKAFGGKVTQYFIGFGPTVWSTRKGETEYGVKAVPLGGYVKIVGMLPPDPEDLGPVGHDADGNRVVKVRESNTGMFTQLISDARAAEWETITAADSDRLFYKMSWWKKVVVMAAGPSVNIAIAFFCFLGLFAFYGNPSDQRAAAGRPVIDVVSRCVIPYVESGRRCHRSDPRSPAFEAGLRPGDVITTFNGVAVTGWDQLKVLIQQNAAGRATIGYLHNGVAKVGGASTTVQARPVSETDQTLHQVGFLGVAPTSHLQKGGPLYTIQQMGGMTVTSLKALGTLPVKVWGVAQAIAGVKPRAQDSPVSIVGGGRLAGDAVSSSQVSVVNKLVFLLGLVAGFNFFIGLFNFVPLLPLDGGHIAGALWEAVRRGLARLRRRPDPGYVDVAKLLPTAYVVASALLLMGVVLIVGDLVVPVHIQS